MRTIVRSTLATALLAFTGSAQAELSSVPSGEYGLDKTHGYITFTYDHLGFSTPHVGFRSFDVNLTLDSEDVGNSEIDVVIDTTSIDSRVEKFDGHLNGANFFDTEQFPQATFTSTGITEAGENEYKVTGDLTIKGVTQSVTLDAKLNKADMHPMRKVPTVGFSAQTKVNRSDFGISRAVPNVGDEVTIYIEVELPQKSSE